MNVKGKGQRLIPEELLKYLEVLKNKYPDAVDLVEANPTLEGGEDSLSSVLINGTKYAVGGGGGATLEDIVDSAGNKRFIENNGIANTVTGLIVNYCKWSLSGTHLMLVCAGTLANANTFNFGTIIANYELPDYIKSKIIPVWGSNIEVKDVIIISGNDTTQTLKIKLNKYGDGVRFIVSESLTTTAQRNFRVQFDLLIDANYSD